MLIKTKTVNNPSEQISFNKRIRHQKIDYNSIRATEYHRIQFVWWLALILMIGDNIVYAFSKELVLNNVTIRVMDVLSILGCLSFPLFSYVMIEYFHYLKQNQNEPSIKSFMLKLFALAVISEPLFDFIKEKKFISFSLQNVFFTFFSGWILLILLNKEYNISFIKKHSKQISAIKTIKFDLFALIVILTAITNLDYGGEGLIFIAMLEFARSRKNIKIWQFIAFVFYFLMRINLGYIVIFIDLIFIYAIQLAKLHQNKFKSIKRFLNNKTTILIKDFFYPIELLVIFVIQMFVVVSNRF